MLAARLTYFRPKILLSEATVGCKTVLASKKLVPDQKASRAVPPRAELIVGSATERDVASKAMARATVHSARKDSKNSLVGLKTGLSLTISTLPELVMVLVRCSSLASVPEDIVNVWLVQLR